MAQMMPDALPRSGATGRRPTQGEVRVFKLLQKLPDGCLAYYEPLVNDRHPDFIAIMPSIGILVLEVKDWYPANILTASTQQFTIQNGAEAVSRPAPLEQARAYREGLEQRIMASRYNRRLIRGGNLRFPRSHACVMANATRPAMSKLLGDSLNDIFPPHRTIFRDELLQLAEATPEEVLARLNACFDPWWRFAPLAQDEVDILRAIIHPEVIIEHPEVAPEQDPADLLRYLDRKQEQNARRIGEGHRILHGVAGSGKTIILVARAKYLATHRPEKRILLLCFNVCLSAKLASLFGDEYPNVKVTHFHGLARLLGVHPQRNGAGEWESDQELGARALAALNHDHENQRNYDAVLVDEAQDFEPTWLLCARLMNRDPESGDLLIVADGNQGLYRDRRRVVWCDLGIRAKGRSYFPYLNLDRNYRNTIPILAMAEKVLPVPEDTPPEVGISSVFVDSRVAVRHSPIKPWVMSLPDREAEILVIAKTVVNLINGSWKGQPVAPILPSRIAVLYPRLPGSADGEGRQLINDIQTRIHRGTGGIPALWVSDPAHLENRLRAAAPMVRIQTVHSSKGLEFDAVVIAFADLFDERHEVESRRLFYVGMTRAEDYLAITGVGQIPWISD